MKVSVDIDDPSWLAIDNLEAEAQRVADHCARLVDFGTGPVEATILFSDDETVAELNHTWRGKQGPTNVLSFPGPADFVAPDEPRHLGDIALAYGVVSREARDQNKALAAHTSHLLVHGLLHLAGFDHMNDAEAEIMEAREIEILQGLGIADPYRSEARL
ncbi:MAG: rRNA maturation RNase YbeY [Hyphomicrobiales bacterium]